MLVEFTLIAGILTSTLHVITGPDHLAAVAPFAIESKTKAWKIGFFWSAGHIVGMAVIGLLYLGFKDLLPVEAISGYSEQLVGIVLIGVGLWAIYKMYTSKYQQSLLLQKYNDVVDNPSKAKRQNHFASFSIGILHGLAGVVHFMLLLPVLGFEKQLDSILYITGFCIGIILAMTIFSFVIGKAAQLSKYRQNISLFNGIRLAGGLFAIVIGVYWILNV
ncbi:hypothetical protein [Winogradskyella sp.]|uniref:hypothetical protein n=1 Tax=Winogradskyella sp. TaxID=1883156 RepID=UPI0026348522|nr:hypothetical protein [Winogradskyella sp.]